MVCARLDALAWGRRWDTDDAHGAVNGWCGVVWYDPVGDEEYAAKGSDK